MAVHLSIVLFFTGLTGVRSITTVSKVSVWAGGSVSIPCLYESKYTLHVKYLCKGYEWATCIYEVKTNQPSRSGKSSISDDTHQRIFTVTLNHLMEKSTYYWCAVEIENGADVKKYFHLSATKHNQGLPKLYVDHQEVTAFEGDDITINCHYSMYGEKNRWCRLGGPCVEEPSGSIDGTRVTISANVTTVFTVTMTGLRTESSGWYLCAKGDQEMPVHVTVKERPSPASTLPPTNTRTGANAISRIHERVNHAADFMSEAPTTVQGGDHSVCCSVSIYALSFIITLTLLLCIMTTALFIWFILKRRKQTPAQSPAAVVTEDDVTYSAVKHTRKTPGKRSHAEADVDVMYSVISVRQKTVQKAEREDEHVVYSTLAQR